MSQGRSSLSTGNRRGVKDWRTLWNFRTGFKTTRSRRAGDKWVSQCDSTPVPVGDIFQLNKRKNLLTVKLAKAVMIQKWWTRSHWLISTPGEVSPFHSQKLCMKDSRVEHDWSFWLLIIKPPTFAHERLLKHSLEYNQVCLCNSIPPKYLHYWFTWNWRERPGTKLVCQELYPTSQLSYLISRGNVSSMGPLFTRCGPVEMKDLWMAEADGNMEVRDPQTEFGVEMNSS